MYISNACLPFAVCSLRHAQLMKKEHGIALMTVEEEEEEEALGAVSTDLHQDGTESTELHATNTKSIQRHRPNSYRKRALPAITSTGGQRIRPKLTTRITMILPPAPAHAPLHVGSMSRSVVESEPTASMSANQAATKKTTEVRASEQEKKSSNHNGDGTRAMFRVTVMRTDYMKKLVKMQNLRGK
jgi:hypothetical protein